MALLARAVLRNLRAGCDAVVQHHSAKEFVHHCGRLRCFSAPKKQELVLVRGGKVLELARPDDNGKVQTVHATEVFGMIRSLATCRLTGGSRDYIVLGTDSGKIIILEYSADKQCFGAFMRRPMGRQGCAASSLANTWQPTRAGVP